MKEERKPSSLTGEVLQVLEAVEATPLPIPSRDWLYKHLAAKGLSPGAALSSTLHFIHRVVFFVFFKSNSEFASFFVDEARTCASLLLFIIMSSSYLRIPSVRPAIPRASAVAWQRSDSPVRWKLHLVYGYPRGQRVVPVIPEERLLGAIRKGAPGGHPPSSQGDEIAQVGRRGCAAAAGFGDGDSGEDREGKGRGTRSHAVPRSARWALASCREPHGTGRGHAALPGVAAGADAVACGLADGTLVCICI
jgi:hypothetical protein